MTEPRYLLDTDICIFLIKRKPLSVLERLAALPSGAAVMSVITLGELSLGVEKSLLQASNRQALSKLTALIPPLPLTETASQRYGQIRSHLEKNGTPIGNNDLWIAAHALAEGMVLVTNNEREFGRVPDLAFENWVGATPKG